MREIQHFYILITVAFLLMVWGGTANAFWGFGDSGELNKSGLDLEQGYDRNTVVKIGGSVAVPPRPLAGGLIAFDLNLPDEQMVVVLGPAWYLKADNLAWKVGDRVTVWGSLAQGKDGRTYLLTQRISSPGGTTIVLRAENGSPSWSGEPQGEKRGGGGSVGQGQSGGGNGGSGGSGGGGGGGGGGRR